MAVVAKSTHTCHTPLAMPPLTFANDITAMLEAAFTEMSARGGETTGFTVVEPEVQVAAFSRRSARMEPVPAAVLSAAPLRVRMTLLSLAASVNGEKESTNTATKPGE